MLTEFDSFSTSESGVSIVQVAILSLNMMKFGLKMMNVVFKMMKLGLKMMNVVFKMMN